MSAPIRPTFIPYAGPQCPMCAVPTDSVSAETEILEQYDDGPGPPNDPRRLNTSPTRRNVPGQTVQRFLPCGHKVPFQAHQHGPGCDPVTGVCR